MAIPFYLSYAALWILVIAQSLVLLGVVRLVYQIQHASVPEGQLERGQAAPQFSAVALAGTPISSADFAGHPAALLFVSPSCPSCRATLAELDALRYKADGNVIVICRSDRNDCAELAEAYGLDVLTVADEDQRISRLFGVTSNPTAVIIDEQGRIQSYGRPLRGEELETLFEHSPGAESQEVGVHGDAARSPGRAPGLTAG